jgi:phosphoribosylaminoimidazole-succinocarboxamide synthase
MIVDTDAADVLLDQCAALALDIEIAAADEDAIVVRGPSGESIPVDPADPRLSMLEQVVRGLKFDFENLPLLCRGDSKDIRLLTPRMAVARLLPTVYSFTENRYGRVEGTQAVRSEFSARIFSEMARHPGARHLSTAFIAAIDSPDGALLVERVVEPGNIEVRVKRYHIGSPLHRYRYTENHATRLGGEPLRRWTRFERPVVCFDWRHPLRAENGERLADEPLPDDYASLWIDDIANAKRLARQAFEWLEERFLAKGLQIIDVCFFVDRTGTVIFGEISPDCMRVRQAASDSCEALDKDQWRSGGDAVSVLERYRKLNHIIFEARPESS